MKTFNEEYQELIKWRKQRFAESDKLSDFASGLDGSERNIQENIDAAEYRRRLRDLEKKHNVA